MVSLGPGIALHLIPSTLYEQMVGFFSEDGRGYYYYLFFFFFSPLYDVVVHVFFNYIYYVAWHVKYIFQHILQTFEARELIKFTSLHHTADIKSFKLKI